MVIANIENSLWRPISGPIEDHPMAVCDGQTMDATKLIETDMIRGNYTGTMLYPQYEANSARRWYYMSEQETQDVLLFKGFDTKEDSVKCEWLNTLPFNSPYPSQAGGFEEALDVHWLTHLLQILLIHHSVL